LGQGIEKKQESHMDKVIDLANYRMNGLNAFLAKDYSKAETLLLKALEVKTYSLVEYNLALNTLIKLYHKMRDEWEGAYDKCLSYCREQMDLIATKECTRQHLAEWKCLPVGVGFARLAIELEHMGKYREAIAVCEHAISLGQSDNTKGGFQGRIEKLQKKLGKGPS
jgi:tetratricopeptide (TPR) repeat protein